MTNGTDQKPTLVAPPANEQRALVARALGFHSGWTPNEYLGENLTYITTWSQHELNAVYLRTGGTVTTRPVERSTGEGRSTWPATEIVLTVNVPDVGEVRVVTDWDEPSDGHDLPIMQGIPAAELIA